MPMRSMSRRLIWLGLLVPLLPFIWLVTFCLTCAYFPHGARDKAHEEAARNGLRMVGYWGWDRAEKQSRL
jgi:hypothetical protein